LSFGYSKDTENGLILADVSYSNPFNMKLFSGKNEFLDKYYKDYKSFEDSSDDAGMRRFFYRFKPYGENDLGDYTPPSLTASFYYGYKAIEHYMHSWGISFSVPLGVAWIHNEVVPKTENRTVYDPRPDADHKAWSATLGYGMEVSKPKFPIFFGVSVPIHDQSATSEFHDYKPKGKYDMDAFGRWDPPDWKDLGQQVSISVGVKSTIPGAPQ
jgi:hypothetical protein